MQKRSIDYVIDEFNGIKEDVKNGMSLEVRLKEAIYGIEQKMMHNMGEVNSSNAEEILKKLKSLCIYEYYKYPNLEVKDMIESLFDEELKKLEEFHNSDMRKYSDLGDR